jgi:hypothetical protein
MCVLNPQDGPLARVGLISNHRANVSRQNRPIGNLGRVRITAPPTPLRNHLLTRTSSEAYMVLIAGSIPTLRPLMGGRQRVVSHSGSRSPKAPIREPFCPTDEHIYEIEILGLADSRPESERGVAEAASWHCNEGYEAQFGVGGSCRGHSAVKCS